MLKQLQIFAAMALLLAPTWAEAQTVALRGTVVDSTGAPLQTAQVIAYAEGSRAGSTLTGATGGFSLQLKPGRYQIELASANFTTASLQVEVRAGLQPLHVQLELAPIQQSLDVEDEPFEIAIDPDRNLSGLTLSNDEIELLPEDEEELAQYLEDLAGPGASAVGGTEMLIDGFSGGRLPPRDQIQEVRINNNPYSAEYSRPGHGRIEIRTRAGADQLRGSFGFQLRDDALNARNAFADAKPPYQRRNFRGNLSGPLIRDKMSFAFYGRRSDAEDSDSINAITLDGPEVSALTRPNKNLNLGGRTQINLPNDQMLNFNLEYQSRRRENEGAGGFTLLERATSSENREWEFRSSHTASLSESSVNELRFRFARETSDTSPVTSAVAINVQDAFQSGGASRDNSSTEKNYQFADQLSWSKDRLSLKGGFQGQLAQSHTLSRDNFLGTFEFASLEEFQVGTPITFTRNSGNPVLDLNQFEWGLFLQTDYRVSPSLMLSAGVRAEAQNHISDAQNLDPRVGLAYSIGKSTVIRGGTGFFHQRLNANTVESVMRLDGTRQLQLVIQNPQFPDPFAGGATAETRLPNSLRQMAGDLALPYTLNSSVSLERRLPRGLFASVSYDHIRGVHLYRSRNLNAPLPGETARPDPARGNVLLLESTATSRYQGLNINLNQRLGRRALYGNYTYSLSKNDADGAFSLPASSYDLRAEWGRASNNARHSAFMGFNTPMPFGFSGNTRIRATSGRPYNITTGSDDNFDTITNDRSSGVARNTGSGPAFVQVDITLSKTFRLRKPQSDPAASRGDSGVGRGGQRGGNPPAPANFVSQFQRGGGPGQGGPGGYNRGGEGPGGQGGRGGNNGQSSPQLVFTLNVSNLFNHTNLSQFSGVQTSPFFGRANSARSPREIEVGVQISF